MSGATNQLFVTFKHDYTASPDDFVSFWKSQYEYPNMPWYNDNINVPEWSYRNLYDLFCWKNGMNLSTKKQGSFHRISAHLDTINQLRRGFDEGTFTTHFGWLTPVWKIFLRHVIQPEEAPIFDQHVYRAYRYIHRQEKEEKAAKRIEELYFREYVPFFWTMKETCARHTAKEVDDALWAFGKFLTLYPKLIL